MHGKVLGFQDLGWQDSPPPSQLWQTLAGSSSRGSPPLECWAEQGGKSSAHRWTRPLVNSWERSLLSLERSCLWGDRNWAEERRGTWMFDPGASIQDQPSLGLNQCAVFVFFFRATFTLLGMRGRCPSCPRTLGLSSGLFSLCSSFSRSLPASSGETREQEPQLSPRFVNSGASQKLISKWRK